MTETGFGMVRNLIVVAYSVAIVLAANWVVARLKKPITPYSRISIAAAAVATTLWIGIMVLAGLLAMRYIERLSSPAAGTLVYALTAALLSLGHAFLYRRVEEQLQAEGRRRWDSASVQAALRGLTYVLMALSLCLLLSAVNAHSVSVVLFVPLVVGTLLPDIDSRATLAGKLAPPLARWLETRVGPRQQWHSLGGAIAASIIASPLIPLAGWEPWAMIPLGFVAHLLREMLEPEGLMLFWPLSRARFVLPRGWLVRRESRGERWLFVVLLLVAMGLLLIVKTGPPPTTPAQGPTDVPFEEILAQYQAMRGRTLVYADADGVWQISGRRVSARYEIVGALDQSLILLDRYSGALLSGGHSAGDQLYLSRVSFLTGPEVRIKPVEVNLREEKLAGALPVIYQMQREPGLQYIFASGDVVVPVSDEQAEPQLSGSRAQTRLPKIQDLGNGHFRLRYLTASELIDLGELQVAAADLVITATSTARTGGPTPTPLPQPLSRQEEGDSAAPVGVQGSRREGP